MNRKVKIIISALIIFTFFAIPFICYAGGNGYKVFPQVGMTRQEVVEGMKLGYTGLWITYLVDKDGTFELWNVYRDMDGSWHTNKKKCKECVKWDLYFHNGKMTKYTYTINPPTE